jgi:hypothetical protein
MGTSVSPYLEAFSYVEKQKSEVGRCGLKPADPPEVEARWLRKWERHPMDHYFLTLIYGGAPPCTIQRFKATRDEAL